MIRTISNKMKIIKGMINPTFGKTAAMMALPIKWMTRQVTKYLINQVT